MLKEEADFKSPAAKAKWRAFIMRYEKRVEDYNFGTLLRVDPAGHYTQENTMFGTSGCSLLCGKGEKVAQPRCCHFSPIAALTPSC